MTQDLRVGIVVSIKVGTVITSSLEAEPSVKDFHCAHTVSVSQPFYSSTSFVSFSGKVKRKPETQLGRGILISLGEISTSQDWRICIGHQIEVSRVILASLAA